MATSPLPWSRIGIVLLVCIVFAGGLILIVINLPTTAPPHEPSFPSTDIATMPTQSAGTPPAAAPSS